MNIIPANMVVWRCFAAPGPGQLLIINGTIKSSLYQKNTDGNVLTGTPLSCSSRTLNWEFMLKNYSSITELKQISEDKGTKMPSQLLSV